MIVDKIKQFLQTHEAYREFNPKDLQRDFPLIDSGMLDSIGIFELIVFLEDSLGIKVGSQDIVESNFRDLNAIEKFVQAKQATSGT